MAQLSEKWELKRLTEPDVARLKCVLLLILSLWQNGKNRIVVTELPYMVNKARLIEKIAELVKR